MVTVTVSPGAYEALLVFPATLIVLFALDGWVPWEWQPLQVAMTGAAWQLTHPMLVK
jgi:hypothetical protein